MNKYEYAFILILIIFKYSYGQNQIILKIQGSGTQNILNNAFYLDPSEVIVNNLSNPSCKKSCYLDQAQNNIIIKFGQQITSCQNMFNGLSNIIEIDISKLITSSVTNMAQMFNYCTKLKKINLGNIDTSNVITMREMFCHCESLTSVDVSKFKTSKVTDMGDMFAYMYKLYAIDVSNFDTKKAKDISGMFYQMNNLKYLDLSNFDTSSVTSIRAITMNCGALLYLNLKNFKFGTSTVNTFRPVYKEPSYLKICVTNSNVKSKIKAHAPNPIYDCTNKCFNQGIKVDIKNNRCINKCSKFDYSNICFDKCPYSYSLIANNKYFCEDDEPGEGYFLDNSDNIYKECYLSCKYCYGKGDESNNNCIECKINYTFLNESNILNIDKNCYIECEYYYYFDEENKYQCTINETCPVNKNKIISSKNKCIDECKNDNIYKYEYKNNCYDKCSDNSYHKIDNEYLCFDSTPEGYYFDYRNKIFKKCYKTCKNCYWEGDEFNNNCFECITNYTFLINLNNIVTNCYYDCEYYYYFDNLNNHYCTSNKSCPVNYNKLISAKNKCIDECKNDNIYKYEFRKVCYEYCPPISKNSLEKEFYCEALCDKEHPFIIISTEECVDYCDISEILSQKCSLKYSFLPESENNTNNDTVLKEIKIKKQDTILKNIEKSFTNEKYNISDLDNQKIQIIKIENIIVTLTTVEYQKNNINFLFLPLGVPPRIL